MGKRSRIVHIEWRSRNVDRLKQFYKQAFNWKFKEPMPGYAVANLGNKETGGGFLQIETGSPLQPGIMGFLEAEDLGASEEAIRDAGGQVVASSRAVEGWGRFSVFADPDGNQLALWQSESSVKKAEKHARKAAKKANDERIAAERAEKKAHKKAEKKALKAAKKAKKVAAAMGQKKPEEAPKKKNKDKSKKKKNKLKSSSLETGGAA